MFLTLEKINTALNQLKVDAKPLWGKMSPQHMVEHLILTFRICNGTKEIEIITEDRLLPIQKRFLLSSRPLPKLFINPVIGENLLPLEFESINTAQETLIFELTKYEEYFDLNPESKPAHPVFGYLNKSEWDVFHKKHFEHHFSQFGITI
jgi:hydroxymethylglutaryl-CoA reductase